MHLLPAANHSRMRIACNAARSTSAISRRRFSCSPALQRRHVILALESSADDTCAAVVTSEREILTNVVIKQHTDHEKYGGIHPFVAIEAHQRNMPFAVRRALDITKIGIHPHELNGIAFTRGPGMGGCLSVSANAAKSLAAALNLPLVGVHHMQAHALTPFLTLPPQEAPQYPFLTLLVSGGHTLLLLARSPISFETLATTHDESIGQTFDKVSKLLRIPWSTLGPGDALEKFCLTSSDLHDTLPPVPAFPRPVPKRLQFSYACLHSHVERYLATRTEPLEEAEKLALARAFQQAAVKQLEEKLLIGLEKCTAMGVDIRHLVVSGGVASNMFLRERLRKCLDTFAERNSTPIALAFPPPQLCTDNAAMIAWASMHRFAAGDHDDYSIRLRPKWKIEDLERTDEELDTLYATSSTS